MSGELTMVEKANITKKDIVEDISLRTGLTQVETKTIVECFLDSLVFASIGYTCQYHNQNIHVNRTRTIERLEKLPSSSLLVIHGEGGCGKTAILHEFLERHKDEYPVYYRKASVLNVQTLAQVFHQGNLYAMDDFQDAYKDSQRKYFVIDSAEHLEAMPDETILPTLIRMLIEEGWCVVFTVRNVFLSDLLNFLSLNLKLKNVPTESVAYRAGTDGNWKKVWYYATSRC